MKISQLINKLEQIKNQDATIKIKSARDADAIANDIEEFFIEHEEGSDVYALYPVDTKVGASGDIWNAMGELVHKELVHKSTKEDLVDSLAKEKK